MNKKNLAFTNIFLISFLFLIILRNAWICDDAYITFRTVDNFIHGHGLTWNLAERVQAYTHPLWMMIISFFYLFTKEIYYTVIFLSLTLCALTFFYLSKKIYCLNFKYFIFLYCFSYIKIVYRVLDFRA